MKPGRILVVDDESGVRDLFCLLLRRLGHDVRVAGEIQEAARVLANGPGFDLVLLDLIMPGSDGLSVLREVRADRPGLPCVVISGKLLRSDEVGYLAAEGVPLHPKPFRNEDVLRTIDAILAGPGTGKDLEGSSPSGGRELDRCAD